jgi:hypothetical protein
MESKSADHSSPDAFSGASGPANASRQLRTRLQSVFLDPALRYADAPSAERRDLRVALREVCADARECGLRAEQLLVIIKDVWSTLPAGISHVPSVHGDERLNYVISICVDEYYGHLGEHLDNEGGVSL